MEAGRHGSKYSERGDSCWNDNGRKGSREAEQEGIVGWSSWRDDMEGSEWQGIPESMMENENCGKWVGGLEKVEKSA